MTLPRTSLPVRLVTICLATVCLITTSLLISSLLTSGAAASDIPSCPADHIAEGQQPPNGHEWKCLTKTGVVDGLWLTWYNDQQLLSERHMKLGKEHGRQRVWWPNGQLMMEGVSVDGHRYQGFKYWAVDGTPTQLDIQTETVVQPLDPKPAAKQIDK